MQDKSALVFGGQGTQYYGMGKQLLQSSDQARKIFDLASSIVAYDVAKKCIDEEHLALTRTRFSQVCTLTLEIAIYYVFKEYNIPIDSVAGFSLGEYAALVVAGVISTENAIKLVNERALATEEEVPDGYMYAIIGINHNDVKKICYKIGSRNVGISNYNSNHQCVVSVSAEYQNVLLNAVRSSGGQAIPLRVNKPFHHMLMRPAANRYLRELQKYDFRDPICTCYFNVTGNSDRSISITQKLYEHIYKPVLWKQIIENMLKEGVTVFYEISPKPVLSTFIKDIGGNQVRTVDVFGEFI